ncbi:hypothetical protein [Pseudanabaena yagii]|uniref:Uncharacterized protein n=1 Tax=Pseudanabaena yagii GIHE-NHR1 TaxID=2722753 RepID=A0ABX1LZL8_9CYAN|nr:hypothetical protein [Pseudanabaena yagii]NMF60159.1 hypothetical protein [Pseudanabaena yagii GIHE-NHR1]
MAFPQPAGYYGLQLSEQTEAEISKLSDKALLEVVHDLVSAIRHRTDFVNYVLHYNTCSEIDMLSTEKKVDLLRWLSDRLAFLHTVPVQEVNHE